MMSLIYQIIYSPAINHILRNVNYLLSPILPSKIKIHPSGILKVKIGNREAIYLKTNQTSYVTRELFWKSSKEYEYTRFFIELVKKSDCFIDIGANIGYYSVLAAKVNPSIHIHSFEPSNGAYYYLDENVKINNFSNRINTHKIALSDSNGMAEFNEVFNRKYPNIYNLSGEHNLNTKHLINSKKTEVKTLTLDDFVSKNNISKVDLIKMDTEGCEDLILKKAANTIAKYQPVIICETLFNKIEKPLEDIMKGYGYEFYNFKENSLEKVDTLIRQEDNGVRNCFFVPPQKKHLISTFLKK